MRRQRVRSSILRVTSPLIHRLCCNRTTGELLGLVRSVHEKVQGHPSPKVTVYIPIITTAGSPDTLVLGTDEVLELEATGQNISVPQLIEMLLELRASSEKAVLDYGREDRWSSILKQIYDSAVADVGKILRANSCYTDEAYHYVRGAVMLRGRQ